MDYVLMPDKLLTAGNVNPVVSFVPYVSDKPVVKGKSQLTQHMISLVTQGEKTIYSNDESIFITSETILLLSSGNYLMTERPDGPEKVKSILIFFEDNFLKNVQKESLNISKNNSEKRQFVQVSKDDYLNDFIKSVQTLLDQNIFSESMQVAKLNELLVYLFLKYPEEFSKFQNSSLLKTAEQKIQTVIKNNIFNNLSVSELAFCCHMSLPTFKRKFQQLYDQPPAKWIQQQRLIAAADLLQKGSKPSDVYLNVGYENHSSFSQAFKVQFGVLPKDYV
jgi:AraC-like DNA-binding protein